MWDARGSSLRAIIQTSIAPSIYASSQCSSCRRLREHPALSYAGWSENCAEYGRFCRRPRLRIYLVNTHDTVSHDSRRFKLV